MRKGHHVYAAWMWNGWTLDTWTYLEYTLIVSIFKYIHLQHIFHMFFSIYTWYMIEIQIHMHVANFFVGWSNWMTCEKRAALPIVSWFQFYLEGLWLAIRQIEGEACLTTVSLSSEQWQQNVYDIPLHWLVSRDPYNGLNLQQDFTFTDPEKTWVSNSSIATSRGPWRLPKVNILPTHPGFTVGNLNSIFRLLDCQWLLHIVITHTCQVCCILGIQPDWISSGILH